MKRKTKYKPPNWQLKLTMNNSKVGLALSLPAGPSCPGKTEVCFKFCYARRGRVAIHKQQHGCNQMALVQAFKAGGYQAAALLLLKHIEATGRRTIRWQDAGDLFAPWLCKSIANVHKKAKWLLGWLYTRSFVIEPIWKAMVDSFTGLPNLAVWLSCDTQNWQIALARVRSKEGSFLRVIALMLTPEADEMGLQDVISAGLPKGMKLIVFRLHIGKNKYGTAIKRANLFPCPATADGFHPDKRNPICLSCKACLPRAS